MVEKSSRKGRTSIKPENIAALVQPCIRTGSTTSGYMETKCQSSVFLEGFVNILWLAKISKGVPIYVTRPFTVVCFGFLFLFKFLFLTRFFDVKEAFLGSYFCRPAPSLFHQSLDYHNGVSALRNMITSAGGVNHKEDATKENRCSFAASSSQFTPPQI